jgi:hypothetical protein
MAAPKIRKTMGENPALFLSSLLPGLLYMASGFFAGLGITLLAIFGVTMLKLFRAPLLAASMNTFLENEHRATALSGISMVERVLIALLYPIVGAVADSSLEASLIGLGILTVFMSFAVRIETSQSGLVPGGPGIRPAIRLPISLFRPGGGGRKGRRSTLR